MDEKSLKKISIPSEARGLRVIVVDPDTSSLMRMASILEEKSYEVTTIELPTIALSLIRERENHYDLVIAEVNMPEMDGFTFLKHVLRERHFPTILMSENANLGRAERALDEGACFFWQKPIRMKELINVWQHIFRNKYDAELHKRKPTFQQEESFGEKNKKNSCQVKMKGKRKEEEEEVINLEQTQRLIWTPQLHLKFLKAVHALGDEKKAQPNAVLKLMNVPNLTHRHVASHLQKHRLRVKRNSSKCPNEDISGEESNSISTTSSCDIGAINFQEGNNIITPQGLERQDHQFSEGQIVNQNNLVESFEHLPNLEVNNESI